MNKSNPRNEKQLIRILIAIDADRRRARINFKSDAFLATAEGRHTVKGSAEALAEMLKGPEVREMFGGELAQLGEFENWEFDRELMTATHAFIFDVIQPLDDSGEMILDFETVLGESEDALPDFCAATAMLARFVEPDPSNPT